MGPTPAIVQTVKGTPLQSLEKHGRMKPTSHPHPFERDSGDVESSAVPETLTFVACVLHLGQAVSTRSKPHAMQIVHVTQRHLADSSQTTAHDTHPVSRVHQMRRLLIRCLVHTHLADSHTQNLHTVLTHCLLHSHLAGNDTQRSPQFAHPSSFLHALSISACEKRA